MPKLTEILIISGALVFLGVTLLVSPPKDTPLIVGAPTLSYQRSLLPITTSLYDIGSSTQSLLWNRLFVNYASTTAVSVTNLDISGTCTGCTTVTDTNDWSFDTNFNEQVLTASTTIPLWLKDTLYASSTSFFDGLATLANATATQLTLTDLYISGDHINDFAGTGLTVTGNALTADLGTSIDISDETNLTAGTGITLTNDDLSIDTSQNIATLSNLTSNGFVKTGGGVGTLSVDTTTYESGLTAGDGLTRTVDDFDCDTASGSVFGCLASADWTTFNNKQSAISATFPIVLTGSALSFGGLSTSTAAVVGNIPYFSGVNTFANVATTTLTASSPLSLSQPISVIGSSASVLSVSVTGDWTGTIDGNNFAGGAIGAGELIYGGSAGSFSELAVSTNGFVLSLSSGIPAWVASTTLSTISGTLDISAQSNLAVTAPITLTDDTLSLGNVSVYPAFTYATSTAWTGTTTIPLGTAYVAETWNGVKCFTDVGTLNVVFSDGTNSMDLLNASTTVGTFTLSTNNSFTASEKRYVDVGTPASSPTKISCTVKKTLSIN